MQHLCSRTLKPSHTESFVDSWTSFPEDSRVSHSQLLESVKLLKTPDTSSPTSQTELESANLELFSLKTYKESSAARQPTESQFSNMSSESWKDWVIEQRQEYSQRKKSAHLIRESESTSLGWSTPIVGDAHLASNPEAAQKRLAEGKSTLSRQVEAKSWPTARTSDAEGGRIETEMTDQGFKSKRHKSNQTFGAKLRDAVETHEEQKNWSTPTVMDTANIQKPRKKNPSKQTLGQRVAHVGLQDQANPNTNGKSQESWLTPRVLEVDEDYENYQKRMQESSNPKNVGKKKPANLTMQAKNQKSWGTPRTSQAMSATITENLVNRNVGNLEEQQGRQSIGGKLNPNWVEHLMGLPAGWTDLGSWETE